MSVCLKVCFSKFFFLLMFASCSLVMYRKIVQQPRISSVKVNKISQWTSINKLITVYHFSPCHRNCKRILKSMLQRKFCLPFSYSAFHTVLHNSFCRNPADTSSSYDFNSQSEEILDEFGDVVVVRSKPSKSSAPAHHHQPSPVWSPSRSSSSFADHHMTAVMIPLLSWPASRHAFQCVDGTG